MLLQSRVAKKLKWSNSWRALCGDNQAFATTSLRCRATCGAQLSSIDRIAKKGPSKV
jgi:hypothetical protein